VSKKVAILITVTVVVLVYLFLLVALPVLLNTMPTSTTYDSGAPATPTVMYFVPGVIGILAVVAICKLKKEAEHE